MTTKKQWNKTKYSTGFPVDAYETSCGHNDVNPIFSEHYNIVEFFKVIEDENELKTTFWIADSIYKAKPDNPICAND